METLMIVNTVVFVGLFLVWSMKDPYNLLIKLAFLGLGLANAVNL